MFTFASNPLQPLIDVFEAVLKFFHDDIGLEWGLSIVFLTLIVRVCLLPLTLRQFRSMQSMARHQPEMKRIQTKYKGDKDRLNQELMKFYKENSINPLASCLPLVAQIPVFISLFYMLRKDLRVDICPKVLINNQLVANPPSAPHACPDNGAADFLFIPNLTTKAHGGVLVTLIILYVGSQLISTVMSTVSADNTQKYIMYALPFFFVTFVFRFPAGLLLYWITTNLWTIVQQAIVRRRLGPLRPPKEPDDDDGSTPKSKSGGLLKSLGLPGSEPAAAGIGSTSTGPAKPPPAPPRKKKKKSGRRR
ncbi:MAG: YidC/Oxa1 family rane protein insertase [Solirubrobacteraceae bacterium]|jgi:YidC/Oxa1 family membrane protein insertase|nr:YidC/Oxa1 family rane protein insertase [Solirubrobacteraceae bacterium]